MAQKRTSQDRASLYRNSKDDPHNLSTSGDSSDDNFFNSDFDDTTPVQANNLTHNFTLTPAKWCMTHAPSSTRSWETSWLNQSKGEQVIQYACEVCRKKIGDLITRNRHQGQCRRRHTNSLLQSNNTFTGMVHSLPESPPVQSVCVSEPPTEHQQYSDEDSTCKICNEDVLSREHALWC